ncbi:hypothetical protein NDU88_004486 [Pleurodeles waltl]|uniref:Uncharacterized protein n=1 Tax=Pleurodeles waltl TaxID=8319 RepID=A0AAV7RJF2_PLEWA|nr:hypothetical protein NDU88_004486 [Pleurodeles waltl]
MWLHLRPPLLTVPHSLTDTAQSLYLARAVFSLAPSTHPRTRALPRHPIQATATSQPPDPARLPLQAQWGSTLPRPHLISCPCVVAPTAGQDASLAPSLRWVTHFGWLGPPSHPTSSQASARQPPLLTSRPSHSYRARASSWASSSWCREYGYQKSPNTQGGTTALVMALGARHRSSW